MTPPTKRRRIIRPIQPSSLPRESSSDAPSALCSASSADSSDNLVGEEIEDCRVLTGSHENSTEICRKAVFMAQLYRTGSKSERRDLPLAEKLYCEAVRASTNHSDRAVALTEFARFLLFEYDEGHETNIRRAICLLEEAVTLYPFRETLSELINVYMRSPVTKFRDADKARKLREIRPQSGYWFDKHEIVSVLDRDGDSDDTIRAVMEHAVVRPRSCILLTLGAPARGKTATLNSLRGLDFTQRHVPTEMAEMNQFIADPSSRWLNDDLLQDLDFRENSFRAAASRVFIDEVRNIRGQAPIRNGREQGHTIVRNSMNRKRQERITPESGSWANVRRRHGDVLERVRQSLTQWYVPSTTASSNYVRCWDLGGQDEYEMAHSLFISRADILMFVVDLERVRNESTRAEEVTALCYWMQLAFMLVRNPANIRIIILGTHRGKKETESSSLQFLRRGLAEQLGKDVYDEWIRAKRRRVGQISLGPKFIAIENSYARRDPQASGLSDLESVLKEYSASILSVRKPFPLRWLAVVDKLKRLQRGKRVIWCRSEVEEVCKDFPGFPADDSSRNREIYKALCRMTSMTGTTCTLLFELSEREWVLSISPERVVDMFRKISGPLTWTKYLKQDDLVALEKSATLSERTIMTQIWGSAYTELEKRNMISLLCECDLLMRLHSSNYGDESGGELYGVPALIKTERSFLTSKRHHELLLKIVTRFTNALPNGLRGGLISFLSRTVHEGLQDVEMLGRNSALLSLKEKGRVHVLFNPNKREIAWTCIGQEPVRLAELCIEKLDAFLSHHAHPVRISRDTVICGDCRKDEGCGSINGLCMDLKLLISGTAEEWIYCQNCKVPWRVSEIFGDLAPRQQVPNEVLPQDADLIPADLLEQMYTRVSSAVFSFDKAAVEEACKGLSRVLKAGNTHDVDKFREQLENCDKRICASRYDRCYTERIPCFAISYVQQKPLKGRFKFSEEQWATFCRALSALAECGVTKCRIWLDQCLWLRDAPQRSWAQTGVMPYVLWPVISLGDKEFKGDRTTETYDRMWPFVEEISGLWSLGVITTNERRGRRKEDGYRRWISYNHRERLEPEESVKLLLLNIYHGATDDLRTGWTEDVTELREMARWNMESSGEKVIIGPDWRNRLGCSLAPKSVAEKLKRMTLRGSSDRFAGEYLERSRRLVKERRWHGLLEWLSGNGRDDSEQYKRQVESDGQPKLGLARMWQSLMGWYSSADSTGPTNWYAKDEKFKAALAKIKVVTNRGEFQLLGFEDKGGGVARRLWLVVKMDGRSSNFSRGNVEWTKIVHGRASRILTRMSDVKVVELVLREQLGGGERLDVRSIQDCSAMAMEWI